MTSPDSEIVNQSIIRGQVVSVNSHSISVRSVVISTQQWCRVCYQQYTQLPLSVCDSVFSSRTTET